MGTDKSKLRLGRRTLLGHVRATAQAVGLKPRVIEEDLVPRAGPLTGIYTALATSDAEVILFLSCDMPFISAELLKSLLGKLRSGRQALFVRDKGRVGFPFLLRRTALPVVQRQLAGKQLSLQKLARSLRAQTARLPPSQTPQLFNINTPDDWKIAQQRWRDAEDA